MTNGPRFALYFAPEADSDLHRFGSRWLGRDAITGEALAQPAVPGIAPDRLAELTADARRYGFHGTLKAPFELADGVDPDQLLAEARVFAAKQRHFPLRLSLQSLGGFFALMPAEPTPAIADLAEAAVTELDNLRAPLSAGDLARRRKAGLTAHQEDLLEAWGYPYVMDQFHFHMTLSARLAEGPERDALYAALAPLAAATTEHPVEIASVCLFRQAGRDAPFLLVERLAFAR